MKNLFYFKRSVFQIIFIAAMAGCGSSENSSEMEPTAKLHTVPSSYCKNNSELIHSTCSAVFGSANCKSVEKLILECPARMTAELMGFGFAGVSRKGGSILLVIGKKVVSKTGSYLIKGLEIDKVALDLYCNSLTKKELNTKINSTLCQGRTFAPGRAGGGGAAGFN